MRLQRTSKPFSKDREQFVSVLVGQRLAFFMVRLLIKIAFSIEIRGIEHLRAVRKPFIIAANHPTRIDAAFLCLLPYAAARAFMPLFFPMAEMYYERLWYRILFQPLGAYPMRRFAIDL